MNGGFIMKYKIVVDSSSDLKNDYIVDENVGFEVAPLTIHIGDKHFIDNENINVKEMLESINNGCKSTTSCPNPNDYLKCFNDAENIFLSFSPPVREESSLIFANIGSILAPRRSPTRNAISSFDLK